MIPVTKLRPDGTREHYDLAVQPPALIWVSTTDGALHLNVPELLRACGLPNTEENREIAIAAANDHAREHFPGVPMSVEP